MSPLPVERDLPLGRHAQLRTRLLDEISEPSADRRRLAPMAAAAAAVALLGAAVAVGSLRPDVATLGAPATPFESSSRAPHPAPAIPGLAPADVEAIVDGCARSMWGSGMEGPIPPSPPSTAPPAGADRLALYNMITDAAGKAVLIYGGENTMLTCTIDGPVMKYNASGGALYPPCAPSCTKEDPESARVDVLHGHFAVDAAEGAAGGDQPGNKPIYREEPGYYLAAGRVSRDVAQVTVTFADGTVVEATVRNGTFMARAVYPPTWELPDDDPWPWPQVKAYDAEGRELPGDAAPHPWP